MSELQNQERSQQDAEVKKKNFGAKFFSFLRKILIFLIIAVFTFYGFKYWKFKSQQRFDAKSQVEKLDNIESEIFDLSQENLKNHHEQNHEDLSNITANELQEKGADFVYQMLLKNQIQINNLNEQIQLLKEEILLYKNRERIGQLVFSYVELRQKFYAQESYEESLKNFEILAAFDENLNAKLLRLKPLLPRFGGKEFLVKNFQNLISQLIATKNFNPAQSFISKIRHNISKLVVIRKINSDNPQEIDAIITKIEQLLGEEKYEECQQIISQLDVKYDEILKDFLSDLEAAAELQKVDQEIFNYLKSLT